MTKIRASKQKAGLVFTALLLLTNSALAQQPQDNWYLAATWNKGGDGMGVTNGGLSAPQGVAIGPDGRIYVGDQGYSCIQVYLPDGTYSFSITNGFGNGETFGAVYGMITDRSGNLYAADAGRNCVFVFDRIGSFIQKIGGAAGSDGELSSPTDVGVSDAGDVYVLNSGIGYVSIFRKNGEFLRRWGGWGVLDGQFWGSPLTLAVDAASRVYVGIRSYNEGDPRFRGYSCILKVFDANGLLIRQWDTLTSGGTCTALGASSIRVDASGLLNIALGCVRVWSQYSWSGTDPLLCALSDDGTWVWSRRLSEYVDNQSYLYPYHGVGRDGTVVMADRVGRQLFVLRQVYREQERFPRNCIPLPNVVRSVQRSSSPLVDVDYEVTDADDTNIHTAVLIFTDSSITRSLGKCIRNPSLVEGTSTNVGPNVTANQKHRLTWNAGADWSVNLGQFRVVVLARDSRPGLLDIHYLRLPAGGGMPALKISRSPLIQNDFMQVWWWLLATNDVGITLSSNRIYGASGAYSNKVLCEDEKTTSEGRAYLCQKMGVREATAEEVQWARQATMPTGTNPNQWPPGRSVSGRPAAVNEYGFDTGNWAEDACWVVPLN